MLTNPLTWLRSMVKNAVLSGVADAFSVLDGTDNDEAAQTFLESLTPELPVSKEEPSRKRKGE